MAARSCYLRAFAKSECSGGLQRAHLIKQQTIRRRSGASLTDPRSWVWACVWHHTQLDQGRKLRIPRHRLPAELEAFALEAGLTWWLDREYGPPTCPSDYPSTAETCLSDRALNPGAYDP